MAENKLNNCPTVTTPKASSTTSNATYGSQLADLKSAFEALTEVEKQRSYIRWDNGGDGYLYFNYLGQSLYNQASIGSEGVVVTLFRLSDSKAFAARGASVTEEITSQTMAGSIILFA